MLISQAGVRFDRWCIFVRHPTGRAHVRFPLVVHRFCGGVRLCSTVCVLSPGLSLAFSGGLEGFCSVCVYVFDVATPRLVALLLVQYLKL